MTLTGQRCIVILVLLSVIISMMYRMGRVNCHRPDSREIADNLDVQLLEKLGVANARTLENLHGYVKFTHDIAVAQELACGVPRVPLLITTNFLALI